MSWIRAAEEERERRPADAARCAVGVFGFAVAGLWSGAGAGTDVSAKFVAFCNGLPDALDGMAHALVALGSVWAVLAVGIVLVVVRRFVPALTALVAGCGALGIATACHSIFGPQSVSGLSLHLRTGAGPLFPTSAVASIAAVGITLSPYLVRPVRRLLVLLLVLTAIAAMYLGTALVPDVVGAVFLGIAVAGAVLAVVGAPGGRPSVTEVRAGFASLSIDAVDVAPVPDAPRRASAFDVTDGDGGRQRTYAFGRDQRDAQLAAKVWRWTMYREPGVPVFGSRLQQVEHIGYGMMLAARAGVDVPDVVRTAAFGSGDAMLVTAVPAGRRLADLPVAEIDDALLARVWSTAIELHDAGISHGRLDAHHLRIDGGRVLVDDFSSVDMSANPFWLDRDRVTLLVATVGLVGTDRAIAAARRALGDEMLGALIPMVQPVSLPVGAFRDVDHLAKQLKELRAALVTATAAEDVAPLKIRRLGLANVGMLIGVLIALAICIPSLQNIDFASVKSQFTHAEWGWIACTVLLYPLIPLAWGTALMGAVNAELPLVPTALTQLAATFLNLVTPNGIGGSALQIDYLHRRDVPVASATSAYALSTGVGGIVQAILLLSAAALSSTSLDLTSNEGTAALWLVALVAALIGLVLLIPKVRGKVVPAVRQAAHDTWTVLHDPRKALQLVGGNLAGNLLYPAMLGLCLLAFGQSLGFAELVVVQIGAGMLGAVAPVPGGMGVQEAALTAGLTSFGIASAPALAAVLVFRTITFFLPPIAGFFTLRQLRNRGLV
jgi:uncharacterized membrane protein YbhN (UPF0104 family)